MPTKFNRQSAKFELDPWPQDPNSIGFLPLSSTTYMWSFESDWEKNCNLYTAYKVL